MKMLHTHSHTKRNLIKSSILDYNFIFEIFNILPKCNHKMKEKCIALSHHNPTDRTECELVQKDKKKPNHKLKQKL